jgi:hypothetical protein
VKSPSYFAAEVRHLAQAQAEDAVDQRVRELEVLLVGHGGPGM